MATIFDYLEWRGDVPFSADPFQEVDNLVLAELVYTDFSGIVPSDGTEITLQDAFDAYFSTHSREELLADKSFYSKCPAHKKKQPPGVCRTVALINYFA